MIAVAMIAIRCYQNFRRPNEERSVLVQAEANGRSCSSDSSSSSNTQTLSSSGPLTIHPGHMLRKMACTHQFWLAAFGNGFLGALKGTGAMFVGVYLRNDCAPGGVALSDSLSMQLAASFNAGIGLSVLGLCRVDRTHAVTVSCHPPPVTPPRIRVPHLQSWACTTRRPPPLCIRHLVAHATLSRAFH